MNVRYLILGMASATALPVGIVLAAPAAADCVDAGGAYIEEVEKPELRLPE